MDRQQKIKEKLTAYLKREPSADELINAEKDLNIMTEVLKEEVDKLNVELAKLLAFNDQLPQ